MHRNSGIKISLVVEFQVAKRYAKVYTGVDPPPSPAQSAREQEHVPARIQVHADRCGRSPEPPTEVATRRYPRPGVPPRPGVHPRGSTSPSLLSTPAPAAGEVPGAVTGTRPGFRRAQISGLTFLAVSARGGGNGKPGESGGASQPHTSSIQPFVSPGRALAAKPAFPLVIRPCALAGGGDLTSSSECLLPSPVFSRPPQTLPFSLPVKQVLYPRYTIKWTKQIAESLLVAHKGTSKMTKRSGRRQNQCEEPGTGL
ncbi:uncharacterized protein LOC112627101 [Theropithecus gelada]|uniref:uncharacterized protein LOC112627101 n=1 Tax=Theropithecus gelada TaxID=9565 RepID=UPI000DC19B9A|nr:uncharacterized protein LOC112627101 [Theropithecus gelada]